jgi:hypothetical protein
MASTTPPTKKTTTAKYEVLKGEEKTVVAIVERRERDPDTGEKISKPFTYKADSRMWSIFLKNRASQGLKVNQILHLPKGAKNMQPDPDKGWSTIK